MGTSIESKLDKSWNWSWISCHSNITGEHVSNNPDLPWDMKMLFKNKNINWEYVKANPTMKWDWKTITIDPRHYLGNYSVLILNCLGGR